MKIIIIYDFKLIFLVFNFTKINNCLDHYIIDLTESNDCNKNTRKCSMNPIMSTDPKIFSLVCS